MNAPININTEIEIGIQLIEWFKTLSGLSNEQFLTYINTHHLWDILNDTSVIKGCIHAEEEDVMNLFGRHLEKRSIESDS